MNGCGTGIRRKVMAADRFTQIANSLFRDGRLSYKAKGIFGCISTHRDGWRTSTADLTRQGRDGEAAVNSALKELKEHAFLQRHRERRPNGTLSSTVYFLTDLPSLQNSRSQPESGYPALENPTLAHPGTKNTIGKKTNRQKTSPLRPGARRETAFTRAEVAPPAVAASLPPAPPAGELHPGIQLLLEIAADRPEMLLTGKALTDQGRVAAAMMDTGFRSEQLRHIITDRPLPHPVRTSVGAIVAARLRAAQAYPPPAAVTGRHGTSPADDPAGRSPTAPASARTVNEALAYRALVECAGCGVPTTAPGEDLCPACLDWPLCRTCPGPTPRRAHPGGDGSCATCRIALTGAYEGVRS